MPAGLPDCKCWHNSALGEEVSAWLQVTFKQSYNILNDKIGLLVDVSKPLESKPLTLQLKQTHKSMQGKTEKPDVLKDTEAERKIPEKMR